MQSTSCTRVTGTSKEESSGFDQAEVMGAMAGGKMGWTGVVEARDPKVVQIRSTCPGM